MLDLIVPRLFGHGRMPEAAIEMIVMSDSVYVPDALDEASASVWARPDLDVVMAGAEPFREDEAFEIADLADEEWDTFVWVIQE